MSQYIITGGEGFIGYRIVENTAGVSFDIKSDEDILDKDLLERECRGKSGIFHCASKISVPESFEIPNEYYKTNVIGTRNVIEVAERFGLKIVFSSSAAVYGESNTTLEESHLLCPQSPYAENKIEGEKMLENSKIPHIVLRYFNVYGPNQSKEYAGVITSFIANALSGHDLVIYGDGNQIRDFIFVEDVAKANILAMKYQNKTFETFNIASGIETSINDLANLIIRLTKSPSKIVYRPSRKGDIVYSKADVSKARKILGFEAKVSLEEGLRKTILRIRSVASNFQ